MKIKKLALKNFKRFTDLTIDNIPDSTKLVLLIGSNGSGKSSIFDAFELFNSLGRQQGLHGDGWEYYRKVKNKQIEIQLTTQENAVWTSNEREANTFTNGRRHFYGRTSFRQIPRLTRTALGHSGFDFPGDTDRPRLFIEKDNRFENDIEKITETILKDFFRSKNSNEQIREKYIQPINIALGNIFGEGSGTRLQLIEIIPPLEGKVAQINFQKGKSEIHYNYLSAGEKEVFNLLVNLLSRGSLYTDTVYFFDEIDLHLNTKLQFNLIKEITENWIPDNCQLWTASHSLGFIEYAKQSELGTIIDFDDFDFDLPRVLSPEPKDNPDVYDIVVGKDFLPSLFRQMDICFVENKDKDYYASIGVPNTVFVSDNNRNNVYHKVRTSNFKGIVDRDFLTDDDIHQIKKHYSNLRLLRYYSIENYMYHPDNLEEYFQSKNLPFDKVVYITQLTEAKNEARDAIISSISITRTGYPYFGEPEFNGSPLQKRFKNNQENFDQTATIVNDLKSDDLETYYKLLPMKTYCTQLSQRQHISKSDLTKTAWFKKQILEVIK
jgi:predicted ATP-binding protein involved in virulence